MKMMMRMMTMMCMQVVTHPLLRHWPLTLWVQPINTSWARRCVYCRHTATHTLQINIYNVHHIHGHLVHHLLSGVLFVHVRLLWASAHEMATTCRNPNVLNPDGPTEGRHLRVWKMSSIPVQFLEYIFLHTNRLQAHCTDQGGVGTQYSSPIQYKRLVSFSKTSYTIVHKMCFFPIWLYSPWWKFDCMKL